MKPTKTPRQLAKNASALHKHVGKLLVTIPALNGYEIRQEYSIKKIDPEYHNGREKFDWAILEAKIIVECHGEQHYQPVCFGGIGEDEAKRNLVSLQARDEEKRQVAQNMGWAYVVIKYNEQKITVEALEERIKEALTAAVVRKSFASMVALVKKNPPPTLKRKKYNWPKRKIQNRKTNK